MIVPTPAAPIVAQIEALHARHGPLAHPRPGPDPRPWQGRLPDALLYFWQQYGLGTWQGGRIHIIDPAIAVPLVNMLMVGDPDFDGDTHAIAIGAFGQMTLWSQRHGLVDLNTMMTVIEAPYLNAPETAPAPDSQIVEGLLDMPAVMSDAFDPTGEPLFQQLHDRLGPLMPPMIYAATPAPPTAADLVPGNFILADAREWIEAVLAENSVTLVDWQRDQPDLRLIGDPWPVTEQVMK